MVAPTPDRPLFPCETVEVFAPARLHLGFLDVSGTLGRPVGSLGLTLEGIGTRVRLSRAHGRSAQAPPPERAARLLASLTQHCAGAEHFQLTVLESIPEHVGLGSGTQLGLAIAAAMAAIEGEQVSARSLAQLVERGARSGIGVGAFQTGGFLIDGGKGSGEEPAPLIARAEFPAAWRVILVFDHGHRGLFGEAEKAAFQALPPFPADAAAHFCHLAMLRLLPGLVEANFDPVARTIGEISARLGDYFAPIQGGRFTSPRVSTALHWLGATGFVGLGQSSWGPTGFALMPSEAEARRVCDALIARFGSDETLSFRICTGRNRGAEIRRWPAAFKQPSFARERARR